MKLSIFMNGQYVNYSSQSSFWLTNMYYIGQRVGSWKCCKCVVCLCIIFHCEILDLAVSIKDFSLALKFSSSSTKYCVDNFFISGLILYHYSFFFFFFCNNNCIRNQTNLQPLQGAKKIVGGALLPLQVEGGKERKKWECSQSEPELRPNTLHGERRSLHFY